MEVVDSKQYVSWFRQSTPYINAYRGRVFVVMLPGEAIGHDNFWNIAHDITLLNSLGVKLVLCFGARSQVDAALSKASLVTQTETVITHQIHNRMRVTDINTLDIIKQVVGKLRIDVEAAFSMGLINSPMHGADLTLASGNFIVARPFGIHDGIDFGLPGEVR